MKQKNLSQIIILAILISGQYLSGQNNKNSYMHTNSKIYVAGHNGLVGSAIVRNLQASGFSNIVTHSSKEINLRDQQQVDNMFAQEKPEFVFLAAAKVGGIQANKTYPAQFIYDNIMIQANIINAAYKHNVKKLLFLGSSCIYPKMCSQPIKEEYLLTGALEETNDAYAIAKIAGIKMCQSYNKQYNTNFISCMPTNLYGPNDNFDLQNSHVLPALIRKFHDAKIQNLPSVTLWGTGKPFREFLHVDDLAKAVVFLMQNYNNSEIVNIGTGSDITIKDLAILIKKIVQYDGQIIFDTNAPDGTPKKLLDVTRINSLGWKAQISLEDGIKSTLDWYKKNL